MIAGVVTTSREAIIRLLVRGFGGEEREIEAVVDTGYNGSLALPPALVATLGLPWSRRGRGLLADGGESLFDIHEEVVVWDNQPRQVAVDVMDTNPLVGMSLLYGYELTLQGMDGGSVVIKALS